MVRADPTLAKRRPQLLTSIGHLPIYLGLTPPGRRRNRAITDRGIAQTIEFNVTRMRKALSLANPVQHELSKKTIANDRSNIGFLMDHLGLGGMRRHLAPFTEEIQQFHDSLGDRHLQSGLSRLLHYLAARQLRLENVDDQLSSDFLAALTRDVLIKDPKVRHQNCCRDWNTAIEVASHEAT